MPEDARRIALVVALVVVAAVVPALVSARPANQIPLADVDDGANLESPTADGWSDVPTVDVPLASAPSGLPNAQDTTVGEADVQAASDGSTLYVRLAWADATADESIDGPRDYADAVAIQVPENTSSHPAIAMGSTRTPVNVWYWSADAGVEELYAGGPGSTTAFADPAVQSDVTRTDDGWAMVFSRPLDPDGENRTAVRGEENLDLAFAVWNGSNAERSGQKAVSEWYHLPTGPGPSGPAYESLLWAVAGLAIVLVGGATIYAVRRQ